MNKLSKLKGIFSIFKKRVLFLLGVVVLSGLGWVYFSSFNNQASTPIVSANKTDSQKVEVNQSFDIPTSTDPQNPSQPLKASFQNAQLTNRIIVSQKPQYSKEGTKYLMLNLLIENSNTKRIAFRSRDVVRLIDPNEKKFAPSLFNKDLEIDPDAVKKDVVGFLVPEDMKEFKIQYGALTGEKQILELKFN